MQRRTFLQLCGASALGLGGTGAALLLVDDGLWRVEGRAHQPGARLVVSCTGDMPPGVELRVEVRAEARVFTWAAGELGPGAVVEVVTPYPYARPQPGACEVSLAAALDGVELARAHVGGYYVHAFRFSA